MDKQDKLLKELYFNIKNPHSYSGLSSLLREVKKRKLKIKDDKVREWLLQQEEYTLHRPIRKKFKRNKVIVTGIDDTWQADLVDITKLANQNNGIKFLLTCIDVFSKFAWVLPLKNKSGKSITEAFKEILETRQPTKIQTDKGKEFLNSEFLNYLKSKKIKLYTLDSELKACIVERFNRTLKEKMWRYFTHVGNKKYSEILPDLVDSYNNSYHRTIGMKPTAVNKKNETKIWDRMYGFNDEDIDIKFQIGEKVRISKNKKIFEKGYTPNWTREIFIVNKIIPRIPPVYEIKDLNNELIKGVFYEQELQKIYKYDETFKIEEVIKERVVKGKKQLFVKWLGYPDSFNSWINEQDLVK